MHCSMLLQNFDTNAVITASDSSARFWLSSIHGQTDNAGLEHNLQKLCEGWSGFDTRTSQEDSVWLDQLSEHLDNLVAQRLSHVQEWIQSNISGFTGSHAAVENLHRVFEAESIELKRNVQLCKTKCSDCLLQCMRPRFHEGLHHCSTNHTCSQLCQFFEEHSRNPESCCLPCATISFLPLQPHIYLLHCRAGHGGEHL
jgi:hypothetical protein